MGYITTTSKEIIEELERTGVILEETHKEIIINKVYDAIVSAGEWESNGCDCGQPSCTMGCA